MNTTSLHPLIEESIINYDWAATQFPDYFKNLSNLAPIVWFGALDNDLPKIITFGSNPSDKEFLDNNHNLLINPRFPNLHNHPVVVGAGSVNPMTALANYLEEDYNRYFDNRPYWSWFRPIHAFVEVHYSQHLNISYPLPCIHVDALPFATSTKFTELKTDKQPVSANPHYRNFGDVLRWGADFAGRLLNEIVSNNDVLGIVIVGRENLNQFKAIFKNQIQNHRKSPYNVNGRGYTVEKFDLCINNASIEVIGTSIYFPNSHLGHKLNYSHLSAAINTL